MSFLLKSLFGWVKILSLCVLVLYNSFKVIILLYSNIIVANEKSAVGFVDIHFKQLNFSFLWLLDFLLSLMSYNFVIMSSDVNWTYLPYFWTTSMWMAFQYGQFLTINLLNIFYLNLSLFFFSKMINLKWNFLIYISISIFLSDSLFIVHYCRYPRYCRYPSYPRFYLLIYCFFSCFWVTLKL